jgi:ubiquinone/menaquinone biosynthesis C-methylase UbiE
MRPMPLTRVLEPEVMDSDEEAREYDAMDHAEVNRAFCVDLLGLGPDLHATLDVGTGTALIPIEIGRRVPSARIVAVDLASSMRRLADRNVEHAGLSGVIEVEMADAKRLPYPDGAFRCVVSNSILHHVPDPEQAIAEMRRVLAPGGVLFVRDLVRPEDDAEVAALVARYAANASPRQRALFEASLRAALRVEELRATGARYGIAPESIRKTSDRHVTIAHRVAT